MIRITGLRAYPVGGGMQEVGGMAGGIGLAQPVAAVTVDEGDPELQPLPGGPLEQVRDDQCAAGASADDRDDGPAVRRAIFCIHRARLIDNIARINSLLPFLTILSISLALCIQKMA